MHNIQTGSNARHSIQTGVRTLASVVAATMGPRGRNVAIASQGYGKPPLVTNDGVTIAQSITLEDPTEDLAAQFIKQVASRANETAGDGTTTATVLAAALLDAALLQVELQDANPVQLKLQLELVLAHVLELLNDVAVPVQGNTELLRAVARISSGGDDALATQLAELYERLGPDAAVTLQDDAQPGVTVDTIEGITLPFGWLLPHFVNQPRTNEALFTDIPCLVIDRDLADPKSLLKLMNHLGQKGEPRLVVFCKNMRDGALATAAVNTVQGKFTSLVVRVTSADDFADLAALTGAQIIGPSDGVDLNDAALLERAYLGKVSKVVATRTKTTVVGAADSESLAAHVTQLRTEADDQTSDLTEDQRNALVNRAAKLESGVGVVRVGATTEVARLERKLRVEDAINATAAALRSGVLPGGGAALAHVAAKLRTDAPPTLDPVAVNILVRVLEEPMKCIVRNAGRDATTVLDQVQANGAPATYDANTHTHIPDAIAAGIADPALVTTTALEAAVTAVATLVTTHATITDPAPKNDD